MTPTLRSALLATAGIAVAVLPAIISDRLWPAACAAAAILAIAVATDATLLPRRSRILVSVATPAGMQLGERRTIEVDVALGAGGPAPAVALSALSEMGELFERQPELAAGRAGRAGLSIPLVPLRRGEGRVEAVWIRIRGPLGLVERRFRHPVGRVIPVVPDVRPVRRAALRAAERRDVAGGSKTMRFVGEGSEFAALRDFVPGHDPRAISWRASARHRRLLAREFHAERDQPVILAFDTGHLMSEPLDGIPRLDHAIHAGLLLAWSCLRAGDRVGLYEFSSSPGALRAPEAGLARFGAIREWTSGLAYGTDETNTTLGLARLSERLARRSLVVIMTDFVDAVAARLMIQSVASLARRHLVLFVTPADPAPRRLAAADPASMLDVHRAVVAGQFVRERESVLSRLRRLGAHCIDAEPARLQGDVVERYLWIKRRELL
jgi:uncharacterized protein (DUF58 family)